MKKSTLLKLLMIPSLSLAIFGASAIALTSCTFEEDTDPDKDSPYMVIRAEEDANITLKNVGNNDPNLSYSFDGSSWNTYHEPFTLEPGEKVYLKGENMNGFSHSYMQYSYFEFSGKVSISGSIMALLDNGTATISRIPHAYCFSRLFQNCINIVSVSQDFLKTAT